MPTCLLGVDIGTSGIRIAAVDAAGVCHWQEQQSYDARVQAGHGQQRPQYWWRAFTQLLKAQSDARRADIAGICIAGTSGSVLLADKAGIPTSPAFMYSYHPPETADNPTVAPHIQLAGFNRARALQQVHPGMAFTPVDWFVYRLTQIRCTDYNNALKSGYDPIENDWPDSLIQSFPEHCPPLVAPGTRIGRITSKMAAAMGLNESLWVHAGTTDSMAALSASGVSQPGVGVTSLGSTLALKLISHQPVFCQQSGVYSHRFGDVFAISGASNTGGAVLRQNFTDAQLPTLSSRLAPNMADTLGYWPLPGRGERFPVFEPQMAPRLTPKPDDPALFLQGIFHGFARIEALGYQRFSQLGAPALTQVFSSGQMAKNPVLHQLRQHYLAAPVSAVEAAIPAVGAGLLGWSMGAGE